MQGLFITPLSHSDVALHIQHFILLMNNRTTATAVGWPLVPALKGDARVVLLVYNTQNSKLSGNRLEYI